MIEKLKQSGIVMLQKVEEIQWSSRID
jgi:hypothetical protein